MQAIFNELQHAHFSIFYLSFNLTCVPYAWGVAHTQGCVRFKASLWAGRWRVSYVIVMLLKTNILYQWISCSPTGDLQQWFIGAWWFGIFRNTSLSWMPKFQTTNPNKTSTQADETLNVKHCFPHALMTMSPRFHLAFHHKDWRSEMQQLCKIDGNRSLVQPVGVSPFSCYSSTSTPKL